MRARSDRARRAAAGRYPCSRWIRPADGDRARVGAASARAPGPAPAASRARFAGRDADPTAATTHDDAATGSAEVRGQATRLHRSELQSAGSDPDQPRLRADPRPLAPGIPRLEPL